MTYQEMIDQSEAEQSAYPTSRCMQAHEAGREEWCERLVHPKLGVLTVYYQFVSGDVRDLQPDDYPWDADHCWSVEDADDRYVEISDI